MDKIKLITDTTSDLPDRLLQQYGIDMLSIPIAIDGEGYFERESFTIEDFYEKLEKASEIPKTSRISEAVYIASYEKAYHEGYTHVFCVTINAGASGTNASAHQARSAFYQENPEARDRMDIQVLDSKTYSAGYGHGIILAAEMIKEGKSAEDIKFFLEDWFDTVEIYLACYTLEYAKKSGRINAATAFVGEMLGMRPVIRMVDGRTENISKIRGSKSIVDKMFEQYIKVRPSKESEVIVVYGRNAEESKRLHKMIEKDTERTVPLYQLGAAILINAGPDVCAFIIKGKKRD